MNDIFLKISRFAFMGAITQAFSSPEVQLSGMDSFGSTFLAFSSLKMTIVPLRGFVFPNTGEARFPLSLRAKFRLFPPVCSSMQPEKSTRRAASLFFQNTAPAREFAR